MNNDLISREALKKVLHNFFDGKIIDEPTYILRDVFCHINNAPTVEAIPLEVHEKAMDVAVTDLFKVQEELNRIRNEKRQCEWTNTSPYDDKGECPFCCYLAKKFYNFCPNCGADMRGEEK